MSTQKAKLWIALYSASGESGVKYWGNGATLLDGKTYEVTVWGTNLNSLQAKVSGSTGMLWVMREKKERKGYSLEGDFVATLLENVGDLEGRLAGQESFRTTASASEDEEPVKPVKRLSWTLKAGVGRAVRWGDLLNASKELHAAASLPQPEGATLLNAGGSVSAFDQGTQLLQSLENSVEVRRVSGYCEHGADVSEILSIVTGIGRKLGCQVVVLTSDDSDEVVDITRANKKQLLTVYAECGGEKPDDFIATCEEMGVIDKPIDFAALRSAQPVMSFL